MNNGGETQVPNITSLILIAILSSSPTAGTDRPGLAARCWRILPTRRTTWGSFSPSPSPPWGLRSWLSSAPRMQVPPGIIRAPRQPLVCSLVPAFLSLPPSTLRGSSRPTMTGQTVAVANVVALGSAPVPHSLATAELSVDSFFDTFGIESPSSLFHLPVSSHTMSHVPRSIQATPTPWQRA